MKINLYSRHAICNKSLRRPQLRGGEEGGNMLAQIVIAKGWAIKSTYTMPALTLQDAAYWGLREAANGRRVESSQFRLRWAGERVKLVGSAIIDGDLYQVSAVQVN